MNLKLLLAKTQMLRAARKDRVLSKQWKQAWIAGDFDTLAKSVTAAYFYRFARTDYLGLLHAQR